MDSGSSPWTSRRRIVWSKNRPSLARPASPRLALLSSSSSIFKRFHFLICSALLCTAWRFIDLSSSSPQASWPGPWVSLKKEGGRQRGGRLHTCFSVPLPLRLPTRRKSGGNGWNKRFIRGFHGQSVSVLVVCERLCVCAVAVSQWVRRSSTILVKEWGKSDEVIFRLGGWRARRILGSPTLLSHGAWSVTHEGRRRN